MANNDIIGYRLNSYKSQEGHMVVRLCRGGEKYHFYILNDDSEKGEVLSKIHPVQ